MLSPDLSCGYIKHEKIGKGTYGHVYRVEDPKTGIFYALKQYEDINNQHPNMRDYNVIRELNMLASFNHPNIVKPHRIFMDDCKDVCCILEFMDSDLYEYLIEFRKSLMIKLKVFFQIVNGVDFLHENNVIHGDLKSKNILIKDRPEDGLIVKISDLDCMIVPDNKENISINICTLHYKAPELKNACKGLNGLSLGTFTNKIDIWSLGCLFYEIFYPGDEDKILRLQHAINTGVVFSKIPKKFYGLFLSMLSVDPNDRPSTKQILYQLNALGAGETYTGGLCKFTSPFLVNDTIEYKEIKLKVLPLIFPSRKKIINPHIINTTINILDRYFYGIESISITSFSFYKLGLVCSILSYKIFGYDHEDIFEDFLPVDIAEIDLYKEFNTLECSVLEKLNFELYKRI